MSTIKIPKGNSFSLKFEFKLRNQDGSISVLSINELTNVSVSIKTTYNAEIEIESYKVGNYVAIDLDSDLDEGSYFVTIKGQYQSKDVSSNLCDCFEIVKCNDMANYTDCEYLNSPIVIDGGTYINNSIIGGTTNHEQLSNLDYANSGHVGFASNADILAVNESIDSVASDVAELNNNLNSEVGNRENADTELQDNIDALESNIALTYATKTSLPTKTSDLTNDSGYITTSSLPTKTSDLTNDSGFVDEEDYATSTNGGVVKIGAGLSITNGVVSVTSGGVADSVEWDNVLNKPIFATVATSGSYTDLSSKPTIPTKTSELTNDSNFASESDIPTKTSDLTNDSGYTTKTYVDGLIGDIDTILDNINGEVI